MMTRKQRSFILHIISFIEYTAALWVMYTTHWGISNDIFKTPYPICLSRNEGWEWDLGEPELLYVVVILIVIFDVLVPVHNKNKTECVSWPLVLYIIVKTRLFLIKMIF